MTLSIDLDDKTEAQLAAIARREGIDMPALVKRLVTQYLPSADPNAGPGEFGGKSFGEMFGDLIGGVEGGPTDMAEHPEKYMNGFGETESHRAPAP